VNKVREYRIMGHPYRGARRIIKLRDGFRERMEAQVYMDTEISAGRISPRAWVTSALVKLPGAVREPSIPVATD